jgi:hypothetical protein
MAKKRISYTEQHEWMRVIAWFNNFTVKVSMTYSYSGFTVRFRPPDDKQYHNDLSKTIIQRFKVWMEDVKNGATGGDRMRKLRDLATQHTDFDTFLNTFVMATRRLEGSTATR